MFHLRIAVLCNLLLLGSTVLAAEQQHPTWPNRPVPNFNVMLNDDGDWTFSSPDPVETSRSLRIAVDSLAGTAVKTYILCAGLGSDVMYYPTQAGSIVGWRKTDLDTKHVLNAKSCIEAGFDAVQYCGERARKSGLMFMPSYRMNDAHFARDPLPKPLTGKFWIDNHERFAMKNNRLDFTHPEVREFRMGIISEIIQRYGQTMDGLELDFSRHGVFFPADQNKVGQPLLTEMVERVRQQLDEVEKKRGRPCYLVVRVWPTPRNNLYCGMDVEDWMRRRLVDVVVPTQLYATAFDMPIEEFVKVGQESGAKVYPCLYQRTAYTWPFFRTPTDSSYASAASHDPTPQMLAGATSNMWAMGADGFELYNFRGPLGPLGVPVQRVCGNPSALTALDRVYPISPAEGSDIRAETTQPLKYLPTKLSTSPTTLHLYVGEDFTISDSPHPGYIALRLGLSADAPDLKLAVRINGHELLNGSAKLIPAKGPAELSAAWPVVPRAYIQLPLKDVSWLTRGQNNIDIQPIDVPPKDLSLIEVQLGVLYNDAFPQRI